MQSVNEDDVEEDSELKTVTNVIETETDTLVNIVVDEEKIQTTKTHPWYVEGKGFTDAEYIIAGDKVLTADGELKVVESIEVEILDEPIIVYNLEVEDNRTYYVGNNEILVHNACSDELKKAYKEARTNGDNASSAYKKAKDATEGVADADDFVGVLKGQNVTLKNVKSQTIQYT
ncbi:MAG: polymorphic toxin-type HINT domain-containing protein, partial [Clostridium sp.]